MLNKPFIQITMKNLNLMYMSSLNLLSIQIRMKNLKFLSQNPQKSSKERNFKVTLTMNEEKFGNYTEFKISHMEFEFELLNLILFSIFFPFLFL